MKNAGRTSTKAFGGASPFRFELGARGIAETAGGDIAFVFIETGELEVLPEPLRSILPSLGTSRPEWRSPPDSFDEGGVAPEPLSRALRASSRARARNAIPG